MNRNSNISLERAELQRMEEAVRKGHYEIRAKIQAMQEEEDERLQKAHNEAIRKLREESEGVLREHDAEKRQRAMQMMRERYEGYLNEERVKHRGQFYKMRELYERQLDEINRLTQRQVALYSEQIERMRKEMEQEMRQKEQEMRQKEQEMRQMEQMQQEMRKNAERDAEKHRCEMQTMKKEHETKLDEINRRTQMQADLHKEQMERTQQEMRKNAERDAEKHRWEMDAASYEARMAKMQRNAQAFVRQQVANMQNRQIDLAELRAGFSIMQGEHNMQQALLLLHIIANYCFEFANKFQESYNTVAEKKKAVENVGTLAFLNPFRSNSEKTELNGAEVAHKTIKDLLIPALHKLMTAFTSFSAAIGSIKLKDEIGGQVTTVINNFETHIRDLTDEVSKTSNMQIESVTKHEIKMRSLLDELFDKLKLNANDKLEAKFIEKQEELLLKMQTYIVPGSPRIESTFELSSMRNTLPSASISKE
ncbi:hypothetical protein WR25_07930 [Diploscapter pachys]|uniref:Uncharacterized protein n=1 Tax=Diploscapter pachys TaxID=2018661 RepID=A0A2A2KKG9_9BILA|nr:hypothetical protein WR25_07930 [Diploscapter pachys]